MVVRKRKEWEETIECLIAIFSESFKHDQNITVGEHIFHPILLHLIQLFNINKSANQFSFQNVVFYIYGNLILDFGIPIKSKFKGREKRRREITRN